MRARLEYVAERCPVSPKLPEQVNGPDTAARYFREAVPELESREHFAALYLDSRNGVRRLHIVSIGTLNASLVHPREVYAPALEARCGGVIILHNHPSVDPEPSAEDIAVTTRMQRAGEVLGIRLLDHVVCGSNGSFVSLHQRGVIREPAPWR